MSFAGVRSPFPTTAGLARISLNQAVLTPPDSLLLGSVTAKRKLVVFADYECPPCRHEWPIIEAAFARQKGDMAVYYRQFPLTTLHPHALESARIAETAKVNGHYLTIHQELLNLPLSGKRLKLVSKLAGKAPSIDQERVVTQQIERDIDLGLALGVAGTPSMYFVDGDEVYKATSLDFLAK